MTSACTCQYSQVDLCSNLHDCLRGIFNIHAVNNVGLLCIDTQSDENKKKPDIADCLEETNVCESDAV